MSMMMVQPYRYAPPSGGSFQFDGVNDYLELGSAAISNAPLTLACFFKPNAAPDANGLVSLSSGSTARYSLENVNAAQSTLKASSVNSSGTVRSATGAAWTAGAWNHGAGTLTSSASKCFINGTGGSAGLSAHNLTGLLSKTTIGCSYSAGSRFNFFDGLLAQVAIWSMVLSDAEIASLAAGTLPSAVQAGNLVFYAPLTGGTAIDTITGNPLTVSGAVSSADAPF